MVPFDHLNDHQFFPPQVDRFPVQELKLRLVLVLKQHFGSRGQYYLLLYTEAEVRVANWRWLCPALVEAAVEGSALA
jgi:hypothetical protein